MRLNLRMNYLFGLFKMKFTYRNLNVLGTIINKLKYNLFLYYDLNDSNTLVLILLRS